MFGTVERALSFGKVSVIGSLVGVSPAKTLATICFTEPVRTSSARPDPPERAGTATASGLGMPWPTLELHRFVYDDPAAAPGTWTPFTLSATDGRPRLQDAARMARRTAVRPARARV